MRGPYGHSANVIDKEKIVKKSTAGIPKKLLDKPTEGWKADLPLPQLPPELPLRHTGRRPNFVNDIYLELSGSRNLNRTVIFMFALLTFSIAVATVKIFFFDLGSRAFASQPVLFIFMTLVAIGTVLGSIGMVRTGTAPPRDEPVRFNRKRGKVYVYRFHRGGPITGKGGGVFPSVFNWEDLRAETWSRTASSPSGVPMLAWGVDVAVVAPGTNHVVDRFQLAGSNANGEHMWAMARAYMNLGAEALPKYPYPPRDWNNEVPTLDPGLRLAPKVRWPAGMDLESRTAP